MRSLVLVALLSLATPAHAQDIQPKDWFGPLGGDIELSLAGNFGHLFNSEVTAFDLQVGFGYFFNDFLEGGLALQFGYFNVAEAEARASANPQRSFSPEHSFSSVQSGEYGLASGPVVGSGGESWYAGTELFLRFFPFSAFAKDALPKTLSPFVGLEFGALYAEELTPFIVTSLSVGLNIYVTEQIALTPELGYGLIYATDDAVSYGGEDLEHALAANFGLSVFFTP